MVGAWCSACMVGVIWVGHVHGIAIGHTKQNAPDSHPNSEVKLLQARVVLGWGTTREGRVLIAFLLLPTPPTPSIHVSRTHPHARTPLVA